jgi:hypothetical protein
MLQETGVSHTGLACQVYQHDQFLNQSFTEQALQTQELTSTASISGE